MLGTNFNLEIICVAICNDVIEMETGHLVINEFLNHKLSHKSNGMAHHKYDFYLAEGFISIPRADSICSVFMTCQMQRKTLLNQSDSNLFSLRDRSKEGQRGFRSEYELGGINGGGIAWNREIACKNLLNLQPDK